MNACQQCEVHERKVWGRVRHSVLRSVVIGLTTFTSGLYSRRDIGVLSAVPGALAGAAMTAVIWYVTERAWVHYRHVQARSQFILWTLVRLLLVLVAGSGALWLFVLARSLWRQ